MSKFVTVHIVQGNYGQGWEDECCSQDRKEALADLKAYRQNSAYTSRLIRRRVKREDFESGNF